MRGIAPASNNAIFYCNDIVARSRDTTHDKNFRNHSQYIEMAVATRFLLGNSGPRGIAESKPLYRSTVGRGRP